MLMKRLAGVVAGLCLLMAPGLVAAQTSSQYTNTNGSKSPGYVVLTSPDGVTTQPVNSANPLPTGHPDFTSSGTLDASVSNAAVTIPVNGNGTAGITITGLTGSGATLAVEGNYDGTNWFAASAVAGGTGILSTSYTANASFTVNAGGRRSLRLRVSATGTGTVTVGYTLSGASSDVRLSTSLPPGSNPIGSLAPTTNPVVSAQQTCTASAVALPNTTYSNGFIITALSANTGTAYLGGSGVTTGTGYPLLAGQSMAYNAANSNQAYLICSNTTDIIAITGN